MCACGGLNSEYRLYVWNGIMNTTRREAMGIWRRGIN